MNTLVLACLLCFAFSAVGVLGSELTFSTGLSRVTGGPASGEGLQSSLGEDEEPEVDDDLSGGAPETAAHVTKKKKKGKGKKRPKHKNQATTAFNPEHTYYTSGQTSGHTSGLTSVHTTTEDPCGTTHLSYCIHGFCKYMEGLQEPVCVCMKGYDGERCGIQLLGWKNASEEEGDGAEVVQTILVVIAVVLSIISCTAILLMTCAHYRTHKNFMAAYLGTGTGTEEEKLQKPVNDVMV